MENILEIAKNAKKASIEIASFGEDLKNQALLEIAKNIENNKSKIFEANEKDLNEAKKMVEENKLSEAVFNRLKLDENKMNAMIDGIRDVAKLQDPVNQKIWAKELDEGLTLYKVSTPIGVIGVIFEARPDVIAQISALAIKSANAVILKGGKEATNTNIAIFSIIKNSLNKIKEYPKNVINLMFSREDVSKMLEMDEFIDLIIPRGGNKLVQYIKSNTKIPVLGHADGICHIFIDKSADKEKVEKIVIDSKTQYPSACNAVETLLIHENYPFFDDLKKSLKNSGVEIIEKPENWHFEYGEKKLALKKVKNVKEAIIHINTYGSGHTDSILSENMNNVSEFMNSVDSAGVFHNASTRFSDGFRYGFGAEVGISTNKTHARGPVGLEGLTIYKYKLFGSGQIVHDYCCGKRKFSHKFLK